MSCFVAVTSIDQSEPGSRWVVSLDHREILVLHQPDQFYAISNICTCPGFVVGHSRPGDDEDPLTHGGRLARLEPGQVVSGTIRCPAHHSVYDMLTGRPISGMAEIALATFETRIDDGLLVVATRTTHERRSEPGE
jgi:nitrite reductase/ring-hydroxylating ferredoxin subunit